MTDQEIVQLYVSGNSFKKVILASGKSLNYIRKRLRDAGVERRAPGLPRGFRFSEERREKYREIRKGKKPALGMKHSPETRHKMSESRKGSGNGRWIDGRKQTPYPPEWTKTLRESIRQSQNFLCAICEVKVNYGLHVHHIDHIKTNCKPSNLVGLCKDCHGFVHRKKMVEVYRRWLTLYARCRDAKVGLLISHSTDTRPSLVSLFKAGSHKYWQSRSS